MRRGVAVPARQQHHGGAGLQRSAHAALHAGDVEEGQHRQIHGVLLDAEPLVAGHQGVLHRAVGVHAALGVAGGARGIGHHAKVVGTDRDRAGFQVLRQRRGPQRDAGLGDVLAWRLDEVGHLEIGRGLQVVRVGGDDDALQALVFGGTEQRPHLRIDVLRHDGHRGAAVPDVVAQFGRHVHGIDRHHHGVGAQDGVVGQHELRAVLHVEQHPVAFFDTLLFQPAGDAFGINLEFGEADLGVVEHQVGFVGEALCRNLDVVEQVGFGHAHVARQALGPVGEVTVGHVGFSLRAYLPR